MGWAVSVRHEVVEVVTCQEDRCRWPGKVCTDHDEAVRLAGQHKAAHDAVWAEQNRRWGTQDATPVEPPHNTPPVPDTAPTAAALGPMVEWLVATGYPFDWMVSEVPPPVVRRLVEQAWVAKEGEVLGTPDGIAMVVAVADEGGWLSDHEKAEAS